MRQHHFVLFATLKPRSGQTSSSVATHTPLPHASYHTEQAWQPRRADQLGQFDTTDTNTGASVAKAFAVHSNPWRFCRNAGTTNTQTPAPPPLDGGARHKQGSVQRHWFGGYSWATVAAHNIRPCDEKTVALLSQELSISPAPRGASVANAGTTVAKHPLVPG